jgi:fatty acid-binding protein DegV
MVRIITDTTSCISPAAAQKYGIPVIPLNLIEAPQNRRSPTGTVYLCGPEILGAGFFTD